MGTTSNLPSVVIAGRPNVGKSTLFNRLTASRRSIVTNEPGITRDRIYGVGAWRGRSFEVVDTGGIIPDEQAGIPGEILRQARVAFDGAAKIVLVVDGRAEVTPLDAELARLLHGLGKPVFIAVNKSDTAAQESLAAPFFALGKAVFPISAEHGTGVDDLVDALTADLSAESAAEEIAPAREIRVAIIGRPNVGKSTLLNRLAGAERAIVSPIPGTTRDAVDTVINHGGRTYRLVDTAGIRRKGKTKLIAEKLSVVMARRHLEQADVALVVVDASQGVTSNDATIASYAQQSGRATIVVMNKWDLAVQLAAEQRTAQAAGSVGRVKSKEKEGRSRKNRGAHVRDDARDTAFQPGRRAARSLDPSQLVREYEAIVRGKLKFLDYAPVLFLSAKTGERTDRLFAQIGAAFDAHNRRVATGELNRWFDRVDLDRGTSPTNRKVRIYYITQAAAGPPTFVLFTNQQRPLHFSYERFLENQLRAAFDFTGTPIRFNQRLKKTGGRRAREKTRRR
jgi:GTP-binding protein